MDFSLIVPCYNEAQNLPVMFKATTDVFDAENLSYELIFVDDGSSDGSDNLLASLANSYRTEGRGIAQIKIISFSRNFGKEAAMLAGLKQAEGDIIGFIDADMQQDPTTSLTMLRFLQAHEYYDCVAAMQNHRKESLPLRAFKKTFYSVFNDVSSTHIEPDVSDFRVFRRSVADAILNMPEHNRFSKGLFGWVGFRTYVMPYQVHKRLNGKSKWSLRGLISYGWNGMLAFSTWPLKIVSWLGLLLFIAGIVVIIAGLYQQAASHVAFSIELATLCVVLIVGGVQLIALGIFGEYMSRVYLESKNRPQYIARNTTVIKSAAEEAALTAPATHTAEPSLQVVAQRSNADSTVPAVTVVKGSGSRTKRPDSQASVS